MSLPQRDVLLIHYIIIPLLTKEGLGEVESTI